MTNSPSPSADAVAQRLNDLAGISRRVAHDFDNILTGIIGFAELLVPQVAQGTPSHKYVTELLRVCDHGIQLTKRLHQFHRCGEARPLPCDPRAVILAEESRWRSTLPPAVSLQVELPSPLPQLRIDQEPLRQVLQQIVVNAIEACVGGGQVTVSANIITLSAADADHWLGTVHPGPHVEIAVTDSGKGIAADVHRRLFIEPFVTTKPKHRGLGLPMVFRILHAHNGGIRLESPPGGNCTARIVAPAVS